MRFAVPVVTLLGFALASAAASAADDASCAEPPAAEPASTATAAGAALARGNALLRDERPADAIDAYAQSEQLARSSGDERTALLASANRARALIAAGRTQELAAVLDAAAAQVSRIEDESLRATLLANLARTWTRWQGPGTPDRAARAARVARAAALLVDAETAAVDAGDRRLHSYALGYRAALYEEAERTSEALTLTRRALREADAANAPDAAYRWQWQLGRLQRRAGNGDTTTWRGDFIAAKTTAKNLRRMYAGAQSG